MTSSDYGDERKSELMIPSVNVHSIEGANHDANRDNKTSNLPEESANLESVYDARPDTRRLTLGVRPLPPEDPADNPEQRARFPQGVAGDQISNRSKSTPKKKD
ncbi:unnamed protein product [marine sediment metagenome]|uniref:Uncharacterized protein n=1 Tax=marine sediment metagenome TaxID=412755 RepID=X1MML3_9ZZZZ